MTPNTVLSAVLSIFATLQYASAHPTDKRNPFSFVQSNPYGDAIFELGEVSYLANTKHPKATFSAKSISPGSPTFTPLTVIKTNTSSISQEVLEKALTAYLDGDDVFTNDFLETVYISTSQNKATLDASAAQYISSLNTSYLFLDSSISLSVKGKFNQISVSKAKTELPAGPYIGLIDKDLVSLASVYRLYEDTYRTFLFGAYDANDGEGNHLPLGVFLPKSWDNMIP